MKKSRGKFPIIKLCRILHCVGRRPKGLTELKFKFIITRELGKLYNKVVIPIPRAAGAGVDAFAVFLAKKQQKTGKN